MSTPSDHDALLVEVARLSEDLTRRLMYAGDPDPGGTRMLGTVMPTVRALTRENERLRDAAATLVALAGKHSDLWTHEDFQRFYDAKQATHNPDYREST